MDKPIERVMYLNAFISDGKFFNYDWNNFKGDGKLTDYGGQWIFTGVEHKLSASVPEDFDWRALAIEGARESIKKVQAEAHAKILTIEDFIGKMLAIEGPKSEPTPTTTTDEDDDDNIPF